MNLIVAEGLANEILSNINIMLKLGGIHSVPQKFIPIGVDP